MKIKKYLSIEMNVSQRCSQILMILKKCMLNMDSSRGFGLF